VIRSGSLRIAFVRMAPHPIPNRLLPPELASALGAQVEIFDVEAAVRRDLATWIVNPFYVIAEYGRDLVRRRVRPWRAFFTTTWMFRRMSRLGRRFVARGGFDLSFQIQSLFDARQPGVPHLVYTDHTHLANLEYPDFDRSLLHGERWIALERALYANAATVFTRSRNISESLTKQYGCEAERVVCVGAGSNAQVGDDSAPARAAGAPRILFVGVDWERKGGPELLAAFERVRAAHPDARLVIVGCRPEVAGPNVDVVGYCPVESVHAHYREASIFCLPVHREPFGVAFVEAMHHALPIVGTRVGAVRDLVQDDVNGFLVDVGDVDALAARLDRLLSDAELRAKMGDRSQQLARSAYTWPRVAEKMATTIGENLLPWSRPTVESC
jgi:glycosyltransferase involved in cell wall biosynthesis